MKKFIVLALAAGLLATACSPSDIGSLCSCESLPPSTSESGCEPDVSSVNAAKIKQAFREISGEVAFMGTYQETSVYDQGEGVDPYVEEGPVFYVASVFGGDYFFFEEVVPEWEYGSGARIDLDPNTGYACQYSLDPRTNELVANYLTDGIMYYPFDGLFGNPFLRAESLFGIEDGDIVLVDAEGFNDIYLWNILRGLNYYQFTSIDSLKIGMDGAGTPTTLSIEFSAETEWSSVTGVYSGTFTSASSIIDCPEKVAPREGEGYEELDEAFAALADYNYTVTLEVHDDGDPSAEEYGEEPEEKDYKVVSYVTPDGYFYDYQDGFNYPDNGAYRTEDGFVPFEDTADYAADPQAAAVYAEKGLPMAIRGTRTEFEAFWKYSSVMFDKVEGKYVLSGELGLHENVQKMLVPDANVFGMPSPDYGTVAIELTNDGLIYTFLSSQGTLHIKGTVSNVGTTALPLDTADIIGYDVATKWSEWVYRRTFTVMGMDGQPETTYWSQGTIDAFQCVTHDNMDIIPFVESPYNYCINIDTEDDTEIVWIDLGEGVQIPQIKSTVVHLNVWDGHFEFDTAEEVANAYENCLELLKSTNGYTYDRESDLWIYESGEVHFSVELEINHNYRPTNGEKDFIYGLELVVMDLNPYEAADPGVDFDL